MNRFRFGAMLLCIFIFSIPATLSHGQTATTSLRGVVQDPSGAVVPKARVTLQNKSVDKTISTTTSAAGQYQFPQIDPAAYLITVTATGFGDQTKQATLLVNQPATINFNLTIQASAMTVDVTAAAQTLNTSDATLGDSVDNQTIQALPMEGRDPISLLTLQPGVLYLGNPSENDTVDSRSGAVNGGRSDQGNITLDGMDDNDEIAATAFTGVLRSTLDSTEEFRVTTSNANADTGRSSGAQVSLITKSGTNSFHGALYEYYRPTNTVANEWFHKNVQQLLGQSNEPQKYVQNTFGGTVGGPIKKDKLFFFFNYEGQRRAVDDVVTRTFPTQQFYSQPSGASGPGELGYQDASGTTHYLNADQMASLDSDCDTNLACGVNPNVLAYYQPLAAAGIYGVLSSVGDGVNNAGYVFASPSPSTLNTSIVKIDYDISSKQQIFFRGNLQKDIQVGDENLPGQPPASLHEDNTKGFTLGHTWTPTANIVNDVRYAFIRQGYSTRGIGSGTPDWVVFRFLDQPESQERSIAVNVPVNNITDNLTWTRGGHTLTLGGNWRGISNNRGTDQNSYTDAQTNPYWLSDQPNDPSNIGLPSVGSGFQNSYEVAYDTLVGTVPETDLQYNYMVTGKASGALLSDGAFINRHFHANEFEYYIEDAWRLKPNLTVTFGMRHSILQAPYETHGQQISPTVDTRDWYRERGYAAAKGVAFEQPLSFAPSGKANGRPGYWSKQKVNIAPRFAVVYSPDSRTSFRMGAGMYYDHFGQGIVNSFDQQGSFGLSNTIVSPANNYSVQNAPRFTGAHAIPSLTGCPAPPATIKYPYTPPSINQGAQIATQCGLAITNGIDSHIKTPYSYSVDLSFQHQLPGGFLFEEAYVGRFGRHLLQELDFAEPVDLVDPKGGGDYFHAAQQLSKFTDLAGDCSLYSGPQGCTPPSNIPDIQYFDDMFPFMAGIDGPSSETATAGVYNDEWAPSRDTYGETGALYDLDATTDYTTVPTFNFWQSQFSSMYSWSSIGNSSYNALQVSLRHPASHGLTVDASYTLSKSIDMGSEAERNNINSVNIQGNTADSEGGNSAIQNTWNPKLNKAVSDFDARSLVTVDWVYDLPVGRGKAVLQNASRLEDAVLGGWELSGLTRWSSGLPFSLFAPGWATNWQQEGFGIATAPVQTKKHIIGGIPQVFAGNSATAINNGISAGTPVRLPYPGEAGQRNYFRGDGYYDLDSSLSKTWALHEDMNLKFAAEVYNVPNNVRFDASPQNLNGNLTENTLGAYSGMLTTYRRMQFGLRLDF